MKFRTLSKTDANIYKGIAILMIVIHNFMHLFPTPKEMEFGFNPNNVYIFLKTASNPELFIRSIFSYFGHFGVQIFIFLSAYGLSKKYTDRKFKYWRYMRKRFIAIYPSFFIAIILYTIVTLKIVPLLIEYGISGSFEYIYRNAIIFVSANAESLALKISLISNFVPGQALTVVGPWWFISFIFQFYFIFPVLNGIYSRFGNKGLLAISIIGISLTLLMRGQLLDINIYFTIIPHLPEFCLGMYFAKYDKNGIELPLKLFIIALVVYVLGNFNQEFWYLTHISFLILLLMALNLALPVIISNTKTKMFFGFFGAISLPLFLVNGFLRGPFITWAIDKNDWLHTISLCLLSLGISVIMAFLLLKTEKYLTRKIWGVPLQTRENQ